MLMAMGNNPRISDEAKIKEVAIQFESIMVKDMLDQALAPLLKDSMKNVPGADIYQGVSIDNLADTSSRSNKMVVAQVFERELNKFVPKKEDGDAESIDAEALKEESPKVDLRGNPLPESQGDSLGSIQDTARKQAILHQSL